jgi:hypothetical protein
VELGEENASSNQEEGEDADPKSGDGELLKPASP